MKTYSSFLKALILFFTAAAALQLCSSDKIELTDKKGKVFATKTVKKENDKEILQYVDYDKDRNGQWDHWLAYDDAGALKQVDVDKNGNEKKDFSVHYRLEGKQNTKYKVEKYDKNGTLTQVSFYTGKKVTEIDFAGKDGNIERKVYYDADGRVKNILRVSPGEEKK